MEVRLLQPEKTPLSIIVTLLGMVTEVMLPHPEKAYAPIDFTLLGKMRFSINSPFTYKFPPL